MLKYIYADLFLLLSNAIVLLALVKGDDIGSPYKSWCIGECGIDKFSDTLPGTVLMGGGTDTDEAFLWQIENANGGDFLVLRSSGDDAYNEWIMGLSVASNKPLNSVTTILFNNRKASNDPEVLNQINNAEAIFFAGGDQSEYMHLWSGTPVQAAVQGKIKNVTIGGTSAGCDILGNWIYTAEKGSVDSNEALSDPYNKEMTFSTAFLSIPFLGSIITDTHFVTRDRMGRMIAFLARLIQDSEEKVAVIRGVGVDEHTALLLNHSTGMVQTVGIGTAYVCAASYKAEVCAPGKPLTYMHIGCTRLTASISGDGDSYSFSDFAGDGYVYENSVVKGIISPAAYGGNNSTSTSTHSSAMRGLI